MIIRSQDKRKITTDLNLYIEPRQREANGDVTFRIKNEKMGILGAYSSREKAIKVLDMVFNTCRNMAFVDGATFQMPSDEEVEV